MLRHVRRRPYQNVGAVLVSMILLVMLVMNFADWWSQGPADAPPVNVVAVPQTLAEAYGQEEIRGGDAARCTPAGRRLQQAFDEADLGDHADFCSRQALWGFATLYGHPILPTVPLTTQQRMQWSVYRGTYSQNLAIMKVLRDNAALLRLEGESLPGWLLRSRWTD